MRRFFVPLSTVLITVVLQGGVGAYYVDDIYGGYDSVVVQPQPVEVTSQVDGWPSWIGRLDDMASRDLPPRIVQTGDEDQEPYLSDEWPSWIGRLK